MSPHLSRRELARLAGLSIVGSLKAPPSHAAGKARLGLAPLTPAEVNEKTAREAVGKVLVAATGAASPQAALRGLFAPGDTVGIKVNCLAGKGMSPRVELVESFVALLGEAGLPEERIVVFERSSRELRRAGFTPGQRPGYRCVGIDNDYDTTPSTSGSIGSCFARLASTACTALVSYGVVKDHDLAGISCGAKNWYGIIHNPNKYHDGNCDPYLADLLRHPIVRGKVRLTILDGVTAQCHGGPGFRPDATWALGWLAASRDPLAADLWAWEVIDAERRRRGLPTLATAGRPPRWLATAAGYGLGVGSLAQVEVVRA